MKKLYLSNSLLLFDFWIAISIPFMVHRGLSLESSIGLLSLYVILATVLEYPTGVIGDYFGHKLSVVLGTVFAVLSYILLFVSYSYSLFLVSLFTRALAMTLRSGSIEALLKSESSSIKKDFANFSAIEDVVLFFASVIGGFIAEYNLGLAISVNVVTSFLSLLVITSYKTKNKHVKVEGNIFSLANQGVVSVFKNYQILVPVLLLTFFYAYGRSVKNIFGIMSEVYEFRLSYLGVIIGLGMLVRSYGKYLFGRHKGINIKLATVCFLILLGISGLVGNYWTAIGLLLLGNGLMGIILSWFKLDIIEHSSDSLRASVLSFSGLLSTLSGSVYLFLFGKIAVIYSISLALVGTALFLFVVYGLSLLKTKGN